jgi:hypothetical protein
MKRLVALALTAAFVLGIAGTAQASSYDTWRWNKRHAIQTWSWIDNAGDCGANGGQYGNEACLYFQVKNLKARRITASCIAKATFYQGEGAAETKTTLKHEFYFSLAPHELGPVQISPDTFQSNGLGWDGEYWTASCTWHGRRLR